MNLIMKSRLVAIALPLLLVAGADENASAPVGDPVLEPPTLRCLGVYWIIRGDANRNARIEVDLRKSGGAAWRKGPPLFRVEKGAHKNDQGESKIDVPGDGWLFAGSVVELEPDTSYQLRLRLADPDGGAAEKVLEARTLAEPFGPKDARSRHVVPGDGGGKGTAEEPFRGLKEAHSRAAPGDVFLLHAGVYPGPFEISTSGEAGRPIIWRGAGDGPAIIDGGSAVGVEAKAIDASNVRHVWFEKLTIRNAGRGLVAQNSADLVIRRCHFTTVNLGIVCTQNKGDKVRNWLIADNVLEGPFSWSMPRNEKGARAPEYRGIQVTGAGIVVCYNRVRGFKDAIDTFPSPRCAAIDFHNNEISESIDDGSELDDSERNVRCFENRFTNVFQGVSIQPVHGGPVYIFRNVLYNVMLEPFKMHNSPSGVLVYHNTVVKKGPPLLLLTPAKVHNCVYRNNLFIGSPGNYAYENDAPMLDCDFDYDGFGGGPWRFFLKWNGVRYETLAEVRAKSPVYRHAVELDPRTLFRGEMPVPEDPQKAFDPPDARLRAASGAIDAGQILPGFNDGFRGSAPDLGAYELGDEPVHYGPRPETGR